MYAIAFFSTVILFSVVLFSSNKIAEYITSRKHNANATDADIHSSVPSTHIKQYRHTA